MSATQTIAPLELDQAVQESGRPFLTAEWRYLAMLNYEVDPRVLHPYVPAGTELDTHGGRAYVSMVGFRFLKTKVKGIPVPFHRDFDEVNLRFYVRRDVAGRVRRGVAFVSEVVPRYAIAKIARVAYNEKYTALPMRHFVRDGPASVLTEFSWRLSGRWNRIYASGVGEPDFPVEGGLPRFITEHYWGYSAQPDGGTVEYRVAHAPWRLWEANQFGFDCPTAVQLYGPEFAEVLNRPADSALIAEGSPVAVYAGRRVC